MQLACSQEDARQIVRTAFERSDEIQRYVDEDDVFEGRTGASLGSWGVTVTASINPVTVSTDDSASAADADRHTVTVSASGDFGWDIAADPAAKRQAVEDTVATVYEEWQETGELPEEPWLDATAAADESAVTVATGESKEATRLLDPRVKFAGVVIVSFAVVWLIWGWIAATGVIGGAVLVRGLGKLLS